MGSPPLIPQVSKGPLSEIIGTPPWTPQVSKGPLSQRNGYPPFNTGKLARETQKSVKSAAIGETTREASGKVSSNLCEECEGYNIRKVWGMVLNSCSSHCVLSVQTNDHVITTKSI